MTFEVKQQDVIAIVLWAHGIPNSPAFLQSLAIFHIHDCFRVALQGFANTNRCRASLTAFSIYSKMQSSLSAHRHRYTCLKWEWHHLQQDVIVAVCSSPSLHLSENGSGILAFVSRVQLAANTLQVFKDIIQAHLPTAVWIADFG